MKPRRFRSIVTTALVVLAGLMASCTQPGAPPGPGTASPSPSAAAMTPEMKARTEIQARYDAMGQALRKKSINEYMESFASDYTYRNELGEIDERPAVRAQMIDALGYTDTLEFSARVDDCRLDGEQAHVRVSEVLTSTRKDHGNKRVIEVRHEMQATWAHDSGGWKMRRARELSSTTTMDGKAPVVAVPGPASPSGAPASPGGPGSPGGSASPGAPGAGGGSPAPGTPASPGT